VSESSRIPVILAVAIVALIAGAGLRHFSLEPAQPAPGATEPGASRRLLDTELPDIGGRKQRLAQWKGKVLVVNFWATWCAPCKEEIPALVSAQARLGGKGLQIVGIAIDQVDMVKPYAAQMRMNYPVLIGELEVMELARSSGNTVGGLPYTVVLDRTGKIVRTELGGMTESKLEEMVAKLF
jgi:thiol-disulfide isomerase/thioredoxin